MKMGRDEKYGKRRQITFRIGPLAQERLKQAAALFNMKPCEYVKAILYRDLAIFDEPLDQRRRAWKQKKRQSEDEELGELGREQKF
jgi:uncharacterized Ntn-hydrolase superfamily protein